jgi:hypothetical protein
MTDLNIQPQAQSRQRWALHGTIAALVFCVAVGAFFHAAPYHEMPATAITVPPADCLPSGTGGPCIPFEEIQKMMSAQPDAPPPVPPNPAAFKEEKI